MFRFSSVRVIAIFLLGLSVSHAQAASELTTLEPRPGVKLKLMVLEPDTKPKGVLVLYAGGVGTLSLGSMFGKPYVGDQSYAQNFLVRVRNSFVDAGFVVVLPDVPSDRQKLDYVYRLGEDQTKDAQGVVSHVRDRYGVPIWLIGTSASALSVATGAISLGTQISGVVFSASVTQVPSHYLVYEKYPQGVVSTDLQSIKVPALVISHKDDGCNLSPAGDAEAIRSKLTSSPRVEVRYVSGGSTPRSAPCDALSPHGFLGIEDQVVNEMLRFISG